MARVSMYDIKNVSREKREGWEQTLNNEIVAKANEVVAKANEVVAKASTIPNELLNAWDKESIRLAAEIAAKDSLEQLRREIARILELAGEHYGISEKQFWQRYHARKSVAEKDK